MATVTATKIDDGGPAFSRAAGPEGGDHCNGHPGMSLRDYFAAKAMNAWLGNTGALNQLASDIESAHLENERQADTINRVIAKRSYMLADAMLIARKAGR